MKTDEVTLQRMVTLCLGTFPKNLDEDVEPNDVFAKLVSIDQQIHSLLQDYYNGALYASKMVNLGEAALTHIRSLKQQLEALAADDNKRLAEALYSAVLLGHLYNMECDFRGVHDTLKRHCRRKIETLTSQIEDGFLEYLKARLCCLLGASLPDAYSHWIVFLVGMRRVDRCSDVAVQIWTNAIFDNVLRTVTAQGSRPLTLKDLKTQRFADNSASMVAFGNHCLRARNAVYVSRSFSADYSQYMSELILEACKAPAEFPNANQERSPLLHLTDAIYGTTQPGERVLNHKISKRYLVTMAERSYQDRYVLLYLIQTLIDLHEYDEALAAFETYVEYIDQEQTQNGIVSDVLSVLVIYTLCVSAFNPQHLFVPDARLTLKRFRYRTRHEVVLLLHKYTDLMLGYLESASDIAALTYSGVTGDLDPHLAFMYYRFNSNAFISDTLPLGTILCSAWYALAQFHSYLATYESNSVTDMCENTGKVLEYYRNGLILNCTRDTSALLNYALYLAYNYQLESTVKLCKFILKRSPESFKTWNLLVLALSGLENKQKLTSESDVPSSADILPDVHSNGASVLSAGSNITLEKFIDDALNVAALFLNKNRKQGIVTPIEIRYDILQLKMTQLAVWECNKGVDYILNYIKDVFLLYKELFLDLTLDYDVEAQNCLETRSIGVWLHRPSVIDPSEHAQALQQNMSLRKRGLASKTLTIEPANIPNTMPLAVDLKEKEANGSITLSKDHDKEKSILQYLWLWTASIYLKLDLPEETEQCIVEAETADKPNVRTYTYLGLLTLKSRKFLALQEFERSLEVFHLREEQYDKQAYTSTLLGLGKLFLVDDDKKNSLFISSKDLNAGFVRLKNYLEELAHCFPYGYNSSELWHSLSTLYQKYDDKMLYQESLWRCVELEDLRPVRSFDVCEGFSNLY